MNIPARAITGCVLVAVGTLLPATCSGSRPSNLGMHNGRLSPCPGSPNCVSSQSMDQKHSIKPLRYQGSQTAAHKLLLAVLHSMKRTSIITDTGTYLHAECRSTLFRFVDDVEFFFDDTEKIIHIRSASRSGYSDLGVNRRRVEDIRRKFNISFGATP